MATPTPLARNESRSSSLSSRLFRTKSGEALGERKTSGSRLRKNKDSEQQQQAHVPKPPPQLPENKIESTLGISPRMTSKEYTNGAHDAPPVPPVPAAHLEQKEGYDPYRRTESMTHRGRYSYAPSTVSSINSPRRVRRRKDPTPFNVLVIGAGNSGKTSFINFLKTSLALSPRKQPHRASNDDTPPPSARRNANFTHHYQEMEVDSERVGLTLWDSQGLEKGVIDLQLREISNFVETKFDDTFLEEVKVARSHGAQDTHIHCVFLVLDPARLDQNLKAAQQGAPGQSINGRISKVPRIIGALDEDFDLQVIKTLQGKTVVVPVISKADTITTAHMAFLKKKVWESLKRANLDPLEALNLDEESDKLEEVDEDEEQDHSGSESMPDSPASAHTEDSDTMPEQAAANSKRPVVHKRQASNLSIPGSMMDRSYVPLSILSPDEYSLNSKEGPVGRRFPWGFADPFNEEHCDFVKLKDAVFGEWRSELREASRERFYESWRTHRLSSRGIGQATQPRKTSGGIPIQLARGQRKNMI